MKKILWLASWYPSKVDPYTGDFIERHAQSAALEHHIHVLHVVKSNKHIFSEKIIEEKRIYPGAGKATIIYYRTSTFNIPWLEKVYSNFIYLKLHKKYLKTYIRENGKPDGIHVHIGLKSGMAALFLKWRFQIPYVVSEQWSGLCPEANPSYNEKPLIFRWLWKLVMKNAAGYSAVSKYLAEAMQDLFSLKDVMVIPNVVDSTVFYPSGFNADNIQFIHISTLKFQKNVEQILEATAILKKRLPAFSLLIFGEPNNELKALTHTLNIQDQIEFRKPCPQEELREHIQRSKALILYSRFETFGCVIIESNACGKPVIVSDIPVFHENVKNGITGIFVPLNDPAKLADAMHEIAKGERPFDSSEIERWAKDHYSFEIVGKKFGEFYDISFSEKQR